MAPETHVRGCGWDISHEPELMLNNKAWSRARHSRLQLPDEDLHEYMYYVNAGSSTADVFAAVAD